MRRRVVIVGGGLTGLATAWRLRDTADVTVLEASERVGGAVRTIEFDGARFDVGADAFLARQPDAERLARDLGLGDELVAPSTARVLIARGRRLRPLPEKTVLGVPSDLTALARSGVLSPAGLLRAALEPFVAGRPPADDVSVAEFVGRRFGREVVDALVEPLLGGVYAGSADRLSVQVAAAPLWELARGHRSLLRALLADRRPQGEGPVFMTLASGLGTLVDRLAEQLGDRLHTACRVESLERADGGWTVVSERGSWHADDVVLAVPAGVAARLLSPHATVAADELAAIPYASVAVVVLAYARSDVELPDASGVLVPRSAGRLVKAATFSSRKWPHHAGHERVLMRASVGRIDDDAHRHLDDETLARRVDGELRDMLGVSAPAVRTRVVRWPDALAQYEVGHAARTSRIRATVSHQVPGVHLAGAAFDGVGLAARCREAKELATVLGD